MKQEQTIIMEGKCHIPHKLLDAKVTTTAMWAAGQPGSVRVTQIGVSGPDGLSIDLLDVLEDPQTRKVLRTGVIHMAEDYDNKRPVQFDA